MTASTSHLTIHGSIVRDHHIILILRALCPLVIFLTAFFPNPVAHAGQTQFLGVVEDMPLMKGLREIQDDALVFDKAEGRIIKAVAEGGVTADNIRGFYIDTLPQLGWRRLNDLKDGALAFERENERLEIAMEVDNVLSTVVLFTIEPR